MDVSGENGRDPAGHLPRRYYVGTAPEGEVVSPHSGPLDGLVDAKQAEIGRRGAQVRLGDRPCENRPSDATNERESGEGRTHSPELDLVGARAIEHVQAGRLRPGHLIAGDDDAVDHQR